MVMMNTNSSCEDEHTYIQDQDRQSRQSKASTPELRCWMLADDICVGPAAPVGVGGIEIDIFS